MEPRLSELVNAVVGKPYHPDGRGPEAWGCWHLARHILARGFGVRLPAFAVYAESTDDAERLDAARLSGDFRRTEERPGVLVLMGKSRRFRHVGAVLAPGVIVHAGRSGVGVSRSPRLAFDWPHRECWEYVGRC